MKKLRFGGSRLRTECVVGVKCVLWADENFAIGLAAGKMLTRCEERKEGTMGRAVEGTVAWIKTLPPKIRVREALKIIHSKESSKQKRRAASEICARALIQIAEVHKRACSLPRVEAHVSRNEHYRVAGMSLSRFGSRIGNEAGVLETRRWTPPHAVTLEDRYDRMDAIDAAACTDPPSVTGIQFQQLEMRNGRLDSLAKMKKRGERKARKGRFPENAYRGKF